MDAPAHDGLLHGEAGRDRGERENESGTHHREVTWGWRRGRGLAKGVRRGGAGWFDKVGKVGKCQNGIVPGVILDNFW